MAAAGKESNYSRVIAKVFADNYRPGETLVPFARDELIAASTALGIDVAKNVGDILYSFRYRRRLPASITDLAPEGMEWVIRSVGDALYKFALVPQTRIKPNPALLATKIPDATPELIRAHALSDEQALLALVRYNRLLDIFLGVAAYSLQNHLRTKVAGMGQIEVDEIYIGLDRHGATYVIPVQAKGGSDQIGVVQIEQDLAMCAEKFPELRPRAVAVQFMSDGIALFELTVVDEIVRVVQERHYRLVQADEITAEDRALYRAQGEQHTI